MASNNYNNAVFTFLPPQELPDPRFEVEEKNEDDDDGKFYYKAVEGSYDKSYFIDETTGYFKFPNYNKDRKCLVIVKDLTDYKNHNYWDLSKPERAKFTIDDFEKKDPYPMIEIEDFSEFLEHLPKSFFEKGLTKKETLDVFDEFEQFLNGKVKADEYYIVGVENTPAFKAGLLEAAPAPTAEEAEKLWENVPLELLNKLCESNGLPTAKTEKTTIKRLCQANIPFSFAGAKPSQALMDYFHSFVNLYVEEIRKHVDQFHPVYLKHVWEEVRRACGNDPVEEKMKGIIKEKYWKDRLEKVLKPEDEFDFDDDDEEDEDDEA